MQRNGERSFSNGREGRAAVPPGGFAGLAQQTPAAQATTIGGGGMGPVRRLGVNAAPTRTMYRRPKRNGIKPRAPKRAKRNGTPARMVKGSLAAKRHMAKLRKMAARARKRR